MTKQMIYIADDEKNIRNLLQDFLVSSGYEVRLFENGEDLLKAFEDAKPDLVILDIMMPGKDGLQCCEELREKSSVPIILLTARDTELDYVSGITIGSDDYLTKPFSPMVLLMRIKALLRRVSMSENEQLHTEDLKYCDLHYKKDENVLYCGKNIFDLTQTEFRQLVYMLEKPGKVFTREELLDKIWGYEATVETRVADETVRRIRGKLAKANSKAVIETVWGFGYRLAGMKSES